MFKNCGGTTVRVLRNPTSPKFCAGRAFCSRATSKMHNFPEYLRVEQHITFLAICRDMEQVTIAFDISPPL